ncbi:Pyridoxal-phosphate dependent enzyme-like protein 1 [Elsinoe fawcettii]|nr:Pyridoxal-phosphate dependent enzyme-like protein 1 [Elsinoe fawcettii]
MTIPQISLESIQRAYDIIQPQLIRTPVLTNPDLSKLVEDAVFPDEDSHERRGRLKLFLKCENLQRGGSFKFRGASFFLSQLNEASLRRGVVAYSTGNHAIGLALAARSASDALGFPIPVQIVMSWTASNAKVDKIRALGAIVFQAGSTLTECAVVAEEISRETGATLVPTSSHPFNTIGQGTAGLEFMEQMEEMEQRRLDVVLVPTGGASLLAGTAMACKGVQPKLRIFGTEPAIGAADLSKSRACGQRSTHISGSTIADGLRQPVALCNWGIASNPSMVEAVYAVSDAEIRLATVQVLKIIGMLIEPSSAVPIAALLFDKALHQQFHHIHKGMQLNIGVIITGGNTSIDTFSVITPR